MRYIRRHWQGECSLAWAFWINLVVINLVATLIISLPLTFDWIEYPVFQARWKLVGQILWTGFVFPWQIVGLTRTAHRAWADERQRAAPLIVLGLILIVLMSFGRTLKLEWSTYQTLWAYGFQPDPLADYHITVLNDRPLIHLTGYIGFGVTRELETVAAALGDPNAIEGIILDSGGGRLYEGRALAAMIEQHDWDTYSAAGCLSACPLAYVAGTNRTLIDGAQLGFHQYIDTTTQVALPAESEDYRIDKQYYLDKGISSSTVERMFEANPDRLWSPTPNELRQSTLVHKFVDIDRVLSKEYQDRLYRPIRDAVNTSAVFETGAWLNAEYHRNVVHHLWRKRVLKGPDFDVADASQRYLDDWAMMVLDRAGNDDLNRLMTAMADTIDQLLLNKPQQCLQVLSPERFGNLDYRTVTSKADWEALSDLFRRIVLEPYGPVERMDPQTFNRAAYMLSERLGEDLHYLNATGGEAFTSLKRCRAVSRYLRELLAMPNGQGAAFYRRMRANNAAS